MNILIDRILALSGPLPDPAKHKRYLQMLDGRALQTRADALEADALKPRTDGKWTSLRIKLAATREQPSKRMEVCCG